MKCCSNPPPLPPTHYSSPAMWLNAQDKNYFSEEDVRKRSAEMRAYSQPADNGGVRRGGRARAPANRHHEAAKQQQLKRKNPGTGSRLSGKHKQKTGSALLRGGESMSRQCRDILTAAFSAKGDLVVVTAPLWPALSPNTVAAGCSAASCTLTSWCVWWLCCLPCCGVVNRCRDNVATF